MNSYFIKAGYSANPVPATHEEHSPSVYWSKERLKVSRLYQYPVYALACQLIVVHGFRRVVDVGCGVGTKLAVVERRCPSVEIVGIDQSHAIEFCRQHWNFGEWHVDDFDNPDSTLVDLSGDLVICADVIEHLVDPDVLLAYLRRRVTKNGLILLSTPERDLLRGPDCDRSPNPYHIREWNKGELLMYLESAGFEIVAHTMQLPVKLAFHRTLWTEVGVRLVSGKPVRYNQVVTIRIA